MTLRLLRNALRVFFLLPLGLAAAETKYDLYVAGNDVFRVADPLEDGSRVDVQPGSIRLLGASASAVTCSGVTDPTSFSIAAGQSITCARGERSLTLQGVGTDTRAFFYDERGFFDAVPLRRPLTGGEPLTVRVFTANGVTSPRCTSSDQQPVNPRPDRSFEFSAGTFECKLNAATWTVEATQKAAPTVPSSTSPSSNECPATAFHVDPPPQCGANANDREVTVCVGLDGQPVGSLPVLEQGQTLRVQLVAPTGAVSGTLAVQFERSLILRTFTEEAARATPGASQVLAEHSVRLTSAGKVTIKVSRAAGTLQLSSLRPDGPRISDACTVPAAAPGELALQVAGDYYLSLGLAPVYAANESLRTGARLDPDGVTRVYEDRGAQLDLMMNLVAYPFGVRETDLFGLGVLLGTSLANPGRSWYAGGTVAFPAAGLGVIGGAAAHVVDRLQDGIAAGRPWQAGVEVPTETGAQIGWFAGVNVEDGLFRKVFSALFSDDD